MFNLSDEEFLTLSREEQEAVLLQLEQAIQQAERHIEAQEQSIAHLKIKNAELDVKIANQKRALRRAADKLSALAKQPPKEKCYCCKKPVAHAHWLPSPDEEWICSACWSPIAWSRHNQQLVKGF